MTEARTLQDIRADLRALQTRLVDALEGERSRRRGPLMAELHVVRRMLEPAYPFRSQAGQDVVIDRLLNGKRGGTFVDVGGYDGTTGSNTLFFEIWRGWTGVLVEPMPTQLERARLARRCPCIGAAVADQPGEADFIAVNAGFTQMSGLSDCYDPQLLARVRADPRHDETILTVKTRTLPDILEDVGLEHPDFVSLDIEGGELAVLESFPFGRHRVGIWAIENNAGAPQIGRIMRAAGYDLVEFCGQDDIYRRRQ
ncbi:MAG: FkbM family methyltransferase [Limimaricola sp.]|uniref:FkbM family methyltransferase n=1 Tax=Limimaricola sp. TaxID=2211665 RepID=UPI001E0FE811|nr:FkbM family methyltransferase [Limimaricola sp.]MBI1417270.1 FkbM family methyltransferase [Limimaricola sp.]